MQLSDNANVMGIGIGCNVADVAMILTACNLKRSLSLRERKRAA